MARRKKGPMTLFDKVRKIDPYFAEEVFTATDSNLNEKLLQIAKDQDANEDGREVDAEIIFHRDKLRIANEKYTRPLKACKLKRQLIIQILKERGKPA